MANNPAQKLKQFINTLPNSKKREAIEAIENLTGFRYTEILQKGGQVCEVALNSLKTKNWKEDLSDKFYGDYRRN